MTREEALKKIEELLATYNQVRISPLRLYIPPDFVLKLADLIVNDYKEAVELLQESLTLAGEQSQALTRLGGIIEGIDPDGIREIDPTITVM